MPGAGRGDTTTSAGEESSALVQFGERLVIELGFLSIPAQPLAGRECCILFTLTSSSMYTHCIIKVCVKM